MISKYQMSSENVSMSSSGMNKFSVELILGLVNI